MHDAQAAVACAKPLESILAELKIMEKEFAIKVNKRWKQLETTLAPIGYRLGWIVGSGVPSFKALRSFPLASATSIGCRSWNKTPLLAERQGQRQQNSNRGFPLPEAGPPLSRATCRALQSRTLIPTRRQEGSASSVLEGKIPNKNRKGSQIRRETRGRKAKK